MIAAEKEGRKIAIEVKSFISPSLTSEFHSALGQFINYRMVLEAEDPDRELYLAITEDTYNTFFTLPLPQLAMEKQSIKLLVYNVETEAIISWHE